MADLWREQLGAERVVIAHPVSSEVKASEESKRQWAYAQHKALEEEAERMRVSHEKRERELEARRANELRIRREEVTPVPSSPTPCLWPCDSCRPGWLCGQTWQFSCKREKIRRMGRNQNEEDGKNTQL